MTANPVVAVVKASSSRPFTVTSELSNSDIDATPRTMQTLSTTIGAFGMVMIRKRSFQDPTWRGMRQRTTPKVAARREAMIAEFASL